MKSTREHERLREAGRDGSPWRRWGPYVSDRSWGTVREDYSPDGSAWEYLPHDLARSTAYRWGEDGIAGVCDRYQLLNFALAFWNERDPILKERLFGVVPTEGNHGEDVKEYYFYLDSTPTHSYMKFLYKYPQAEFPYARLVEENRRRGGRDLEFELLDTCVFDEDRYFDVFVEYARASAEDLCIRIEAFNRGPDPAPLHLLPHLWFRNTWAWQDPPGLEPVIRVGSVSKNYVSLLADDTPADRLPNLSFAYQLGPHILVADVGAELLFTNNETNAARVAGPGTPGRSPYVKDAFHRAIVHGEACTNPERTGTKACLHYRAMVPPGGSFSVRLRLLPVPTQSAPRSWRPLDDVEGVIAERRAEADEFYEAIHPPRASEDERRVQRQALAGLLWSKQIYLFDVDRWLMGDYPQSAPSDSRQTVRNVHWRHLNSMRILSMPDKWEYPWFAAWDLAFQAVPLALVDPEFAKEQLWLLLFEQFQHPNGQIPGCEWEFSHANPPVHAWACWRVYHIERVVYGRTDNDWLEACFHKLLMNFAWWVNKVDSQGNNVFEGGFLGLDNITVFDRSVPLPGGAVLEQADGSGWMAMFSLNLMRIALELAKENRVYEGLATKFFQHYIYIGAAMKHMGGRDIALWDERDGFFYDVLRYPDGSCHKLRVRSLVGLVPLFAVERLEEEWIEAFPHFRRNVEWFIHNRQDIVQRCCYRIEKEGLDSFVLTIVDDRQLRQMLARLLDPEEFLSDFGIRSLSRHHAAHPVRFGDSEVGYEPAESESRIMGGNSNWRGPVWFPTSFLMVESLRKLGKAYGDLYRFPLPGEPNRTVTFTEAADEVAKRMVAVFLRDDRGRRPVFGAAKRFQEDPHWRDHLLFYEYFHGDNGAGVGASHQTGWTALVATLIDELRR